MKAGSQACCADRAMRMRAQDENFVLSLQTAMIGVCALSCRAGVIPEFMRKSTLLVDGKNDRAHDLGQRFDY